MNSLSQKEVEYLFSPEAIRERAATIFALTESGKGKFQYHPEKLQSTVNYVIEVIRKNYPTLAIPFHSRWGHLRAGDPSRISKVKVSGDAMERARVMLDLVIPSVLLDAGAGSVWKYVEKSSGKTFERSEGLGVASFYLFASGKLSDDGHSMRADSKGLANFSVKDLEEAFQVSGSNPLVGVEGRVGLLNNLARAVSQKSLFKDGRPGNLVDHLAEKFGNTIPARGILAAVLEGFGSIWPGRLSSGSINLGDVWVHSLLGAPGSFASLVPFHKLSQWMTYSLIEPIQEAGFAVAGVDELTGLAEYRNGGLLLDSGLISLRNPEDGGREWSPGSDLVIEWRALTIYLLDRIGEEVQKTLHMNSTELPLAKVLEGGTWWAGRFLAQEKRKGGNPPLQIQSDGTVF